MDKTRIVEKGIKNFIREYKYLKIKKLAEDDKIDYPEVRDYVNENENLKDLKDNVSIITIIDNETDKNFIYVYYEIFKNNQKGFINV